MKTGEVFQFGEFRVDPLTRALLRYETAIPLSRRAFDVLLYLVQNPGRVIPKDELLKNVWPDAFVDENNLMQSVSALRKALEEHAGIITTVPGRGYQFTSPVTILGGPAALAAEVLQEPNRYLVQQRTVTTSTITERPASLVDRRVLLALAGIAVVAAVATYGWRRFVPPPQLHKVMVGDFLNLTGDPAFDHTLATGLDIGLNQTPYLQLMGAGEAHTILDQMQKAADTPLLGDIALEVCRRSNYQVLLRGRIETSGDHYPLSLEAVNCTTGRSMATWKADASGKDAVLNTLDAMADRARKKLGESNQSLEEFHVPLMEESTFSFDALDAFNTGSKLGNAGKLKECIPYFQKAVDIDPKFAMAQASLGTAYFNLGDTDRASMYAKKAFDLSGGVSQIEKFFIRHNYYYMTLGDLDAAEQNLQEWVRVYPKDDTPWMALTDVETRRGDYPAAVAAGEHLMQYGLWRAAFNYEILARAYLRVNRLADAKRTIAAAQAQGMDGPHLHQILLEIAGIEHDPQSIARESEWNKNQPENYSALEYEAILPADEGKYRESEERFKTAILDSAQEMDANYADVVLLDEADVETQLGRTAKAIELLHQVHDHSSINFAIIAASVGDLSAAEAYMRKSPTGSRDTWERTLYLPELKALLDLHRGDTAGAIAALEISRPYELARCEVIEVRANAYLAAHQGAKAQMEFQKLVDHPGVEDPEMPRTNLAHVGLARAYAMQGDTADSKAEYEKFFTLWQDADSDLAILRQAHAEYARLQ